MNWNELRVLLVGSRGNLGPVWKEFLASQGAEVLTIDPPKYDVKDFRTLDQWIFEHQPESNNIDVVLYNAAIDNPPGSKASFWDVTEILDVNLLGAVRVTNKFLPYMKKRGGGTFIYVGSIMGYTGADWRNYAEGWEKPLGYNLSKAALIQLARSITTQYGRDNIRGCVIAFGPYDNGKFDPEFKAKFLRNVPLGRTISRQTLEASLRFAIEAPEFASNVLCDAGLTCW